MTDEELGAFYHDRFCDESTCRAHDPHKGWSHHEIVVRLDDMRPDGYPGADYSRRRL